MSLGVRSALRGRETNYGGQMSVVPVALDGTVHGRDAYRARRAGRTGTCSHPRDDGPRSDDEEFYRALNVVIVATLDGVEHTYHFSKDVIVHGGRSGDLDGLRAGTTVVLHYTLKEGQDAVREIDVMGDEGLAISEGIVRFVDKRRREVTVGYDNGKTEVFRLSARLAAEGEPVESEAHTETKVIFYYSDEQGYKMAHLFKKVSD
jgi:hypothetical protein